MKKFLTTIMLLGCTLMLQAAKTDEKVTISVGGDSREYEITFTRPTATDDITISNIAVFSRNE